MQTEIIFDEIVLHKENNRESEAILLDNHKKLSKQCKVVYDVLMGGARLTVFDAMIFYNVGDLRRRVCDLRQSGIDIKDEVKEGGFKEYFIGK